MSATKSDRPKHFSMIRDFHVADILTLLNASCGAGAVFACMAYLETHQLACFYLAVALGPLALVFDALDGRVARWRHEHSLLGRELDSLADVISFGVAPASIAYVAGLRGGWDLRHSDHFRRVRSQSPGTLQRDGGYTGGRLGQGQVPSRERPFLPAFC